MRTPERSTWPEQIRALPICPRRKLPIPFSAARRTEPEHDGRVVGDFTITDHDRVGRCAAERLCGVCGLRLGYWIAFLGGPQSAESARGAYSDPPMHEECAEWALRLCPYIVSHRVPRRSDLIDPAGAAVARPPGEDPAHPEAWVIAVTRSYKTFQSFDRATRTPILLFRPQPASRLRRFEYRGERHELAEVTP